MRHGRMCGSKRGRLATAFTLAIAAAGCHPRTGAKAPDAEQERLPAAEVTDEAFAETVHRLLREGTDTPQRSALLAGAVRRQLAHATDLFERGSDVRGAQAVVGALYLLRAGDLRPDMFGERSVAALRGAVKRVSARGDEGRAMALMLMLRKLLPEGTSERAELDRHLASLKRWMNETRTGGDMARLAADERAAIGRALLEPTEATIEKATEAINAWVDRAVRYNVTYQRTKKLPPRKEVAEAYRALQTGAETLAALYLRFGRATDALEAIEEGPAGSIADPRFFSRLRAAAVDDGAEDWRMLARDFARLAFRADGDMDEALIEAAVWGIAIEAYRRDPTSQAIAHLLAQRLVELEMPAAAPLVLRDALGAEPPTVALNAALSTIVSALGRELEAGTPDTARRIFAAAGPVLELAAAEAHAGDTDPSPALIRRLMAGIELRTGHVDRAKPLLREAFRTSPSVSGLTLLATLERQAGHYGRALEHLRTATSLPAAEDRPLEVAEAHRLAFEIHDQRGDLDPAAQALERALELTLSGRQASAPETQVRAERILARVLDGYGHHERAARALDRAVSLAATHRRALGPTVLEAVGRALVHRDIDSARAALQAGLEGEVPLEDLVYGALWLMFLEEELERAGDGKVDRVLLEAVHGEGWTAQLARWGRGRIDDRQLRESARTHLQRVEARFYIAMRARIDGGEDGPDLAEVARDPLVELMEVRIARDLLTPDSERPLPEKYEQALNAHD